MSPICGLINTPNLNFCLSSSKLKFCRSKRVSQTVLHKTQSWMHTTRLNLLMQGSIVYSKIQVVTHHYQRFSCSQYLPQMQVQAQQRYSNALTTKMIAYSHAILQQFIVLESHTTLTLTKMNKCMTSPIGLPLFSNRLSIRLTQDQKGISKACNGVECKGMVI